MPPGDLIPSRPVVRPGSLLARLGAAPRIVVLRGGRLGDFLVATPALRALRLARPGAQITLVTAAAVAPLAARYPWFQEVLAAPPAPGIAPGPPDPVAQERFLAALRARAFDLAVQLNGGGTTANRFLRQMGARWTVGCQAPDAEPLDLGLPFVREEHEVLRYLGVVRALGVETGDVRLALPVFPEDEQALRALPGLDPALLAERRSLGVHLGSLSGARRWPVVHFATVLRALHQDWPWPVVILGRAEDRPLARALRACLDDAPWLLDLTGQTTLGVLAALIGRLRLLLTTDSAPAHMATALGTPSVVIFGSGNPHNWAPLERMWHRPVADWQAPCRWAPGACGCPDDARARCLAAVTPAMVLQAARALLATLERVRPPAWEAGVSSSWAS